MESTSYHGVLKIYRAPFDREGAPSPFTRPSFQVSILIFNFLILFLIEKKVLKSCYDSRDLARNPREMTGNLI